jgi:hypothetical protein
MADAPDSATERSPSRKSEWGNRIISAIIGIVVTVTGALILVALEEREPRLVYSSTESLPFSGSDGEVSIYQVTVSNDGKKEAYDVACAIRIPAAKVEQYKVTASPLLNALGTVSGDTVNVQVPNLNPSESFQISILASGPESLPGRPQVSARGKGIVGTEKAPSTGQSPSEPIAFITLGAASLAVVVTGLTARILRRTRTISSISEGLGDDQRQVLAYVCRAYGLRDLADQYSRQSHETTYWAEADRLGQIAIDSGNEERMTTIERSLLGLIEYKTMARVSQAIVYYNVALINRSKKDDVACGKYLSLAKETSHTEIERRLKVDPRFSPE